MATAPSAIRPWQALGTPSHQLEHVRSFFRCARYPNEPPPSPHLGNCLPRPSLRRTQAREKSQGRLLERGLLG
jgi:hypothetical protein